MNLLEISFPRTLARLRYLDVPAQKLWSSSLTPLWIHTSRRFLSGAQHEAVHCDAIIPKPGGSATKTTSTPGGHRTLAQLSHGRFTMLPVSTRRCLYRSVHYRTFSRTISTIPRSQGPTQVQHIHFVAPKRWAGWTWLQRMLYIVLAAQLFGLTSRYTRTSKEHEGGEQANEKVKPGFQEGKEGEDTEMITPEAEDDDVVEIDADDAWFVPLSWPKRKDKVSYKGTDEEWQEFLKLSRDAKKVAEVKGQAVSFILHVTKHGGKLSALLGEPVQVRKHWLEIDFPSMYSDGYEVTGVLFTNEFIALATRDYQEQTVHRFFKLISPVALVNAFWNVSTTFFNGKEDLVTKTKANEKLSLSVPGVPDLSKTPKLHGTIRQQTSLLRQGYNVKAIPKGCVLVSGRVEVLGKQARILFEIAGFYNPKENGWMGMPQVGIVKIRPLTIRPKR